ncbi:MAG: hypothetical protein FWC73_09440 [Defluviitaleaceae bacterium]|nr:hypothetical protein [Defluviitaleaceae bacterium]
MISAVLDDVIDLATNIESVTDITLEITNIIERNNTVDWQNNTDIHNRIAQEIDDLFYKYEQDNGLSVGFDAIDKIIESIKTVALRRFK